MTTYIVGTFKHGSAHRSLITARKAAYALMGAPRPNSIANVSITKLTSEGLMEMWNEGLVSRINLGPIIYTKYEKDRIIGRWILNKDGTLGRKLRRNEW